MSENNKEIIVRSLTLEMIEKACQVIDSDEKLYFKKIEAICETLFIIDRQFQQCIEIFEHLFEFISAHVPTKTIRESDLLVEAQDMYCKLKNEWEGK